MQPPRSTDSSWDCVGLFLGWPSRLAMQFWCIAIPLEKSTPVELLLVYRYHYIRLHRKTRIGITFPTWCGAAPFSTDFTTSTGLRRRQIEARIEFLRTT